MFRALCERRDSTPASLISLCEETRNSQRPDDKMRCSATQVWNSGCQRSPLAGDSQDGGAGIRRAVGALRWLVCEHGRRLSIAPEKLLRALLFRGSVTARTGTAVDGRTGGIRDGRDEMRYSLAMKHHGTKTMERSIQSFSALCKAVEIGSTFAQLKPCHDTKLNSHDGAAETATGSVRPRTMPSIRHVPRPAATLEKRSALRKQIILAHLINHSNQTVFRPSLVSNTTINLAHLEGAAYP